MVRINASVYCRNVVPWRIMSADTSASQVFDNVLRLKLAIVCISMVYITIMAITARPHRVLGNHIHDKKLIIKELELINS